MIREFVVFICVYLYARCAFKQSSCSTYDLTKQPREAPKPPSPRVEEKRKDVLAEAGLKDGPENFGAASKVGAGMRVRGHILHE